MNQPPSAPGRSNQACKRCYNRKKKCDRVLPRCTGCQHANVQCSFEEQQEESGVFYISYVRGLEQRVAELEQQSKAFQSVPSSVTDPSSPASRSGQNGPFLHSSGSPSSSHRAAARPVREADSQDSRSVAPDNDQQAGDLLAAEVKALSLEATAERYLGSSSGMSFARLTQAVLRRLKPDQYPFSFELPSAGRFERQDPLDFSTLESPVLDPPPPELPKPIGIVPEYPSSLPLESHAYRLADFYWAHSHTLYPFVRKMWFMECLQLMYNDSSHPAVQSPFWLYTMWMVLAIGSTSLSSVMVVEEAESIQYFNNAMLYFENALEHGNISALSAILLQVSYSFFNQVGPNTWYLVGAGVRLAIGMGLHAAPTKEVLELPLEEQEFRKRLFYSLYMMDRVVSISLGRPFGIRDEDIEVDTFSSEVDDPAPQTVDPTCLHRPLKASTLAVPLHIVNLRRIAGRIFDKVYSNKGRELQQSEKDAILQDIHGQLIHWRRTMPFPLPQSGTFRVPHLTTAWFDLNYYNHVIMLYRPSPLCPVLTLEKVVFIAEASSMSIRQMAVMHREQSFAFNWLNLFTLFTTTLTLIYSITAQPEPLGTYLQRTSALDDLGTAVNLLQTFGVKFPSALKCRDIVKDVTERLQSHQSEAAIRERLAQGLSGDASKEGILNSPQTRSTSSGPSADLSPSQSAATSYPSYTTGNNLYDGLQNQVRGMQAPPPALAGDDDEGANPEQSPAQPMETGLPTNLQLPALPNPFGNVTAQFMAAGLGTSADVDMDSDFWNALDGTFDT
ncbi:fungal-specific transcription factor domain-containing protein [Lineolata rhizophorae]|uniref:Fungal-specific transcription factor domain-containing protein n=1 Tax=Lineolata rhizophorae TaxID=578093 RepID=A0A6A6PBE0_9PEZI|nr:fungal-specific transcription factor domain-containing protein [Lineolata rhizophorae]